MKTKTGGPAFPGLRVDIASHCANTGREYQKFSHRDGMSLLDHFAGLAMQELLAGQVHRSDSGGFVHFAATYESVAEQAYEQAAAMLRAREEYTND